MKPWTIESEHLLKPFPAQSGIADIQSWVAYMGPLWCGEPSETQTALEHTLQAISYLLIGKDECVRKAAKVSALLSCSPLACVPSIPTPALEAWSASTRQRLLPREYRTLAARATAL